MRPTPYLLLISILLAACGGDGSERQAPITGEVQDDLGRTVVLPDSARRIIPLAPNVTEIVAEAGGEDLVAAISFSDDFPTSLLDRPRIQTYPLGLEAVVAIEPDLLIANAEVNRPDDAARLAELGIPTYFFQFRSLQDVARALRKTGDLLGTEDIARRAADHYEARLEAVRLATTHLEERPRVLLLIGSETLYAFGNASYTQDLIEIAGGESITRGFRGDGVTLSSEFILDARPDIIVGAWGDAARDALLAHHPALRSLAAIQEGRIVAIDPDIVTRPGPRLADAAEELAALIAGARR